MSSKSRSVYVVLLAAACATGAYAQDPAAVEPRAIAQRFLDAVAKEQWAVVAELTDDQSLWEYATQLRQQWRSYSPAPRTVPTIETYMSTDSLMPRIVAEYMVQQYLRTVQRTELSPLLWTLADVERLLQLDSLSDQELFARRLRAKQMVYLVRVAHRASGCPPIADSPPAEVRSVRGIALLSESEAVVLYDEKNGLRDPDRSLAQLRMHRTRLGWRVVASEEVFGAGEFGFGLSATCSDSMPPR